MDPGQSKKYVNMGIMWLISFHITQYLEYNDLIGANEFITHNIWHIEASQNVYELISSNVWHISALNGANESISLNILQIGAL